MNSLNLKRRLGYVVLSVLCVVLIAGCAATFDNNEYSRLVDIRHSLQENRCADIASAQQMAKTVSDTTQWLQIYSQHLPNNKNTINMLAAFAEGAQAFSKSYDSGTPSAAFCRLKVRNLHDQLDIMLATTARRPR